MILRIAALLLFCASVFPVAALAQEAATVQPEAPPKRGQAPKDARAYIIWPPNGAVIDGGKLWVRMGLQNFGVAPAGIRRDNTGHHHLIIDRDLPPLDEPIPNDKKHIHLGAGQTETYVELPPPSSSRPFAARTKRPPPFRVPTPAAPA